MVVVVKQWQTFSDFSEVSSRLHSGGIIGTLQKFLFLFLFSDMKPTFQKKRISFSIGWFNGSQHDVPTDRSICPRISICSGWIGVS